METYFWKMLTLGRKYEEQVARFFESKGFNVWRLGNFRLPVDLFVWKDDMKFFVEVKYRTNSVASINEKKLGEFIGNSNILVFLIQVSPELPFIKRYKKKPLSYIRREIKELREKIEDSSGSRRAFLRYNLECLREEKGRIYGEYIGTIGITDYKELDWNEILIH